MLVPRIASKASPAPSVPISASSGTSINQSSSSCLVVGIGISCLSLSYPAEQLTPVNPDIVAQLTSSRNLNDSFICELDRDYFQEPIWLLLSRLTRSLY